MKSNLCEKILLAAVWGALLTGTVATAAAGEAKAPPRSDRTADCGDLFNGVGPFDYRERNESSARQWMMQDTKQNHLDPATNRVRQGESSAMVMKDIDFLLREFPNHYPALQLLIEYDLKGGKAFGFRNTDCYLDRARRFTPDDPMVLLAEGYYFWKKGNLVRAEESYQDALNAWPDSGDVNYNFGMFYFDTGKKDKALERARVAYSMNYPLPGLRNRLQRDGMWKTDSAAPLNPPPPTAATSEAAPSTPH